MLKIQTSMGVIRFIMLALLCSQAIASNSINLALPSSSMGYGTDSIKANGIDCSNSIGGSTNVEIGMTGIIENADSFFNDDDPLNPTSKDFAVYARIVIPLDAPRERINCNTLFNLELQVRKLEVQKLRQEIELLKAMQNGDGFDN